MAPAAETGALADPGPSPTSTSCGTAVKSVIWLATVVASPPGCTVSVTEYDALVVPEYTCVGFIAVDVAPSPKSHSREDTVPCDMSVKRTDSGDVPQWTSARKKAAAFVWLRKSASS